MNSKPGPFPFGTKREYTYFCTPSSRPADAQFQRAMPSESTGRHPANGPIAQVNRAFDYGSKGFRFESWWGHLVINRSHYKCGLFFFSLQKNCTILGTNATFNISLVFCLLSCQNEHKYTSQDNVNYATSLKINQSANADSLYRNQFKKYSYRIKIKSVGSNLQRNKYHWQVIQQVCVWWTILSL